MSVQCPVKSSKEWQDLSAKYGDLTAMVLYTMNKEEIPSLEDAETLFNSKLSKAKPFGMQYAHMIRQRYFNNFYVDGIEYYRSQTRNVFYKDNNPVSTEEYESAYEEFVKEQGIHLSNEIYESVYQAYKDGKLSRANLIEFINETYGAPTEKMENVQRKLTQFLKFVPFKVTITVDESIPVRAKWNRATKTLTFNPLLLEGKESGHEVFHILYDVLRIEDPDLLKRGYNQVKDTKAADEVRKLYSELTGDDLENEILADAIGNRAEELFDKDEKRSAWARWKARFFFKIRSLLGIHKDAVKHMAEMIVYSNKPIGNAEAQFSGTEEMNAKVSTIRHLLENLEERQLKTLGDIKEKSLRALERRIASYARTPGKSRATIKELERIYQGLLNPPIDSRAGRIELIKSLGQFIGNALEEIDSVHQYLLNKQRLESLGKYTFTARDLDLMRQQATGYRVLDEISSALREIMYPKGRGESRDLGSEPVDKDGKIKEEFPQELDQWVKALDEAKGKRDFVVDQYIKRGLEILSKTLTPLHSHISIRHKDDLERQYLDLKKAGKTVDDKGVSITIPKQEYIDTRMAMDKEDIEKRTTENIQRELMKASRDINTLRRWLDSVYDSPDAIITSAVRLFERADFRSEKRRREIYHELLKAVEGLEKHFGKDLITDPMKMYEYMLEKDSKGKPTGYIMKEIRSEFWQELSKTIEDAKKEAEEAKMFYGKVINSKHKHFNHAKAKDLTYEEIDDFVRSRIKNFYKENAPTSNAQQKQLVADFFDYAESLYKEGKMSPANFKFFKSETELKFGAMGDYPEMWEAVTPFKDYRKHGFEDEALSLLEDWWRANRIKYSTLKEKWLTKEYAQLKQLDPKDPRVVFYNTIVSLSEEVEANLPYVHRLQGRLPGIYKDMWERVADKQSIKSIAKDKLDSTFAQTIRDTDRGDAKTRLELVDAEGDPVHYLPVYFTTDLHEVFAREYDELPKDKQDKITKKEYIQKKYQENQSFDLASIFYNYFKMGADFAEKRQILPELEMIKYFINNRDYVKRDSNGNVFLDAIAKRRGRDAESTHKAAVSNMAAQFNDWMEATIYGIHHKDEGEFNFLGYKVDVAKFLDNINKYTSASMLGLNLVSSIANVNLGETMNAIEAISGEFFGMKNLLNANKIYFHNMPGIVGDIGAREAKNIVNVLNETFDTLNEYDNGNFRANTKLKRLADWNHIYFLSALGEHTMQSTVMLALLDNMEAKDADGKVLGKLMDFLSVKDGMLHVAPEVKNFGEEEQVRFKEILKRNLSALHGEYYRNAAGAWQRVAILRMAMLFRKFMVPGFQRRWGKKQENELKGVVTEGYYRTFGKFVKKLVTEVKALGVAGTWNDLQDREKANMKRFFSEIGFLMATIVLCTALTKAAKAGDDDDDWLVEALAYLALRQRSELAFFLYPPSAMQILRSPTASLTMTETIIDFFGQLGYPVYSGTFEFPRYQQGNRKGQLKIMKPAINLIPGIKQYYRVKYIDDNLSWWNR